MRDALLSLRRISRTFGGVQAAVDVDLDVHRGEVVALVGDNAAGKSTIARLMGGVLQPTSGEIWFDGRQVSIPSPRAATALGIASVFQESSLVENLDVVDNLYLGQELRTRLGLLDHHLMREQASTLR